MRWIRLEDAQERKRKPFPNPWEVVQASHSGVGSIGAELDFGTVQLNCAGGPKDVPARIILFHCHKDITGPVMSYWFILWHKDYKYKAFDIRWVWEFLGEKEPATWLSYDHDNSTTQKFAQYTLDQLAIVREAFTRCPEARRNELIEKIGTGWSFQQEDPFPKTKMAPPPMPHCQPAAPKGPSASESIADGIYRGFEKLCQQMESKANQARKVARQAKSKGDLKKWDKFNAIARVYEMNRKEMFSLYEPLYNLTSQELRNDIIPF